MEIQGQRLLIVETITWKPHIETAIEIALRAQECGQEVHYLNLRKGLPVIEDVLPIHKIINLPKQRVSRARALLAQKNILLLNAPISPAERRLRVNQAEKLLENCTTLKDVCQLSVDGFPDIGWGAISSAISMLRDPLISPVTHRALLIKLMATSMLVFDKTVESIKITRPDAILLFNGRFATTRAVQRAAQKCGIPWHAHERGCDKDHYWIASKQIHNPDFFQEYIKDFWDNSPALSQAGDDFFKNRRNRIERDWHSYTTEQVSGRVPEELLDGRQWVVYYSSSEDEYAALGDTYVNSFFPTQNDAIRALHAVVNSIPGYGLCIRVHPHVARKSIKEQQYWKTLHLPGALLIGADEDIDSYALLQRAHVVGSYGSTIGIEATYWNKPSLLFGRSIYDSLDVCFRPTNQNEIAGFLKNPTVYPKEGALMYGAFIERFGTPYQYYQAESLHRGKILGVDLDDSIPVRLLRKLAQLAHIRRYQNASIR
ncbi:MAG TPA: hypothetical protein VK959_07210 [Methylophilaceae bacterium]|nr:hypothetical protein [Methylophilaceae bacterium]